MPWTEGLVGYSPWSHRRVRHDLASKQQQQWCSFFITEAMHENYSELRKIKLQVNIKKKSPIILLLRNNNDS